MSTSRHVVSRLSAANDFNEHTANLVDISYDVALKAATSVRRNCTPNPFDGDATVTLEFT